MLRTPRFGRGSGHSAALLILIAGLGVGDAQAQSLNSFAILGGSTITNKNTSVVTGNIGVSPGSSTTGTGPAGINHIVLTGTLHVNDGVAIQAKSDLTTAFNVLMGRPSTANLTGETLGSLGTVGALTAGVYNFDTSASLNGVLTLNGNADDVFIFQIGSTLITEPGSSIVLGGTVNAANVFFVVGSSATLDTTTAFKGQILALASITMNTGATLGCGAAWARNGAVTLDTNTIGICTFAITPGTLGSALDSTGTTNQLAVRDTLNDFLSGGGTLPLSYEVLALLTPAELAVALDQLSGETATGVTRAGSQAMNSFLDLVASDHTGPGVVRLSQEDTDNTVSVMGYAEEIRSARGSAAATAAAAAATMPEISRWTVWAAGFGGYGVTQGDVAAGTHTASTVDFGYAIGFERHVSADTLFGFAISGGGTNFSLADSLGSGRSAMLQAALYGKTDFDQLYLASSAAYGAHAVTTDRFLTIGGTDHLRGEFIGQNVAASLEAGYHMGWFTPFVAVRGQAYLTPAYVEQTISGSSTFALAYDRQVSLSARTEVGAKFNWSTDVEAGKITLRSSVAWTHAYGTAGTTNASFQVLPGSGFTVTGAAPDADAILLTAGASMDLNNGFLLSGSLDTSLAFNARRYGASMHLGHSW